MRCSYAGMEWYCCLPEGHDGPHESELLLPESEFRKAPANPPSVPTLDVEAARTLLTYYVDDIEDDPMLDGLEIEGIDVAATFRALSVFLRDELTELRKDRERLDWMQRTRRGVTPVTMDDHLGEPTRHLWVCDDATPDCIMPTVCEAIDRAARSVHPSETEDTNDGQ